MTNRKLSQAAAARRAFVAEVKAAMKAEQKVLIGSLREAQRTIRQTGTREVRDDGEFSALQLEDSVQDALLDLKNATLESVRAALWRIENGLYGRCRDCREEIPEKRLRALPFASRCRECADRHEDAERDRERARGPLFGYVTL